MKIIKGTKHNKINGKDLTSIIDILFDNKYTIYDFHRSIRQNDIIVK